MGKIDDRIREIKEQQIGALQKKALILEGTDDVSAFQAFLNKKPSQWEQNWCLAAAGNKQRVLDILKKEPEWIGVVDRDEWSAVDVASAKQGLNNLFVLPRFCIESYLISPSEIWAALPDKQRHKIQNGEAELTQAIEADLADWIRHAALWQTIHPMYRRLRDSGYRDSLLDPLNVPDDIRLRSVLAQWQQEIDPASILQKVDELAIQYTNLPRNDLYNNNLYAKKFYPVVVHKVLDTLLGQKSEKDRIQSLLGTLPLPADLGPLWQLMGLNN